MLKYQNNCVIQAEHIECRINTGKRLITNYCGDPLGDQGGVVSPQKPVATLVRKRTQVEVHKSWRFNLRLKWHFWGRAS